MSLTPFIRHRRAGGIVAAFATVGLALTACSAPAAESASDSTPSGEIRVLSNWSGSEGDAFAAVVDGFEAAYPDVTVTIDTVPFDQTQTTLTQQFAAGNAPDAAVALPGMVRQLSAQGLLMDLDDVWDEWEDAGEYNESLRSIAAGANGTTEAVYFKGNVNGLVWYKNAKATEAGLTVPPATWSDFEATLDSVAATGVSPFSVGAQDVWVPTQWVDPILLNVSGAEAFGELQRGEIGWDDDRIVEGFTVLSGLIAEYWPDDALDTGFSDETCGWVTGENIFALNGAFVNGNVANCDSSLVAGDDYGFFTPPAYSGDETPAQAVSGDLFVGAKDTDNPAATRAFLQYLGSVEGQSIWAELGGYIAPNMMVPSDVYPTVNDQRAAELWPKDAAGVAGYDLDDWIGGEIQSTYREALVDLIRSGDVDAFIATMSEADTRSDDQ
ncbi:MAG: extracellular solute-binding protein [Mycetocola sp.]